MLSEFVLDRKDLADNRIICKRHTRNVTIRIQTVWRHNANACCHNRSSLATAPSATQLPCRVPLNGMFHQDSATQYTKIANLKKVITSYFLCYIHYTRAISIPFAHNMYVIKNENARGCAKWQWNALDWCYCTYGFADAVAVSCLPLSFRTHPCVLADLGRPRVLLSKRIVRHYIFRFGDIQNTSQPKQIVS